MSSDEEDPGLFQLKLYGAVPPVTVRSIAPSAPPLQLASVMAVDNANAVGSVIVVVTVAIQPLSSVTVAVYVPIGKELMS